MLPRAVRPLQFSFDDEASFGFFFSSEEASFGFFFSSDGGSCLVLFFERRQEEGLNDVTTMRRKVIPGIVFS